ncbi:MAG: hypothetical protein AAGG07_04670 [Planctomycetota bacterium]
MSSLSGSRPPESRERARTWAGLLSAWTEFAQTAAVLPAEGEGGRWRLVIADIIGLHALTHALAEAWTLDEQERALGLDTAEVSLRRHARAVHEAWRGEALPEELRLLSEDALAALSAARTSGVEFLVEQDGFRARDPGALASGLVEDGFDGTMLALQGGRDVAKGTPGAFIVARVGGPPSLPIVQRVAAELELSVGQVTPPRQVYRHADGPDVVLPMDETLPEGLPLLRVACEAGRLLPLGPPLGGDHAPPDGPEFTGLERP